MYIQIPPPPPKPDFDDPRQKLAKLREGNPHTCTHTPLLPPTPRVHMTSSTDTGVLSRIMCDTIMSLCCEGEEAMTKEEYTKMKQELEA